MLSSAKRVKALILEEIALDMQSNMLGELTRNPLSFFAFLFIVVVILSQ